MQKELQPVLPALFRVMTGSIACVGEETGITSCALEDIFCS